MFTGIITHQGRIAGIEASGSGQRIEIESDLNLDQIEIGASVAHSGVCLTVIAKSAGRHWVEASPETLERTTISKWSIDNEVNLETSLRLGDELGGHLVFGHVDGIGRIETIEDLGGYWRLEISLPQPLAPMVAVKGSIAVDGISLTVTETLTSRFALQIIPHSWQITNLRHKCVGDPVNLEADMLARYVARQMQFQLGEH